MPTYLVKWHAIVTISGQAKAFSGVAEVDAENKLEAIAQVQGDICCAKPDPIELNIDEIMESIS
jgi:hypothetical protein